jgi:hypothetical protein
LNRFNTDQRGHISLFGIRIIELQGYIIDIEACKGSLGVREKKNLCVAMTIITKKGFMFISQALAFRIACVHAAFQFGPMNKCP